jgi:hypothetical protein
VRPLRVAAVCVLAGLAAGAIWTWAQDDSYRADARVLVRPASSRIVPAIEALAESSLIESNVAQTLHLSSPPDIEASRGDNGVLTVSAEADSREHARQVDAEAVVLLAQKVQQRFGTTPGVTVTQLDPAHAAEQTSPTPGRNLLITGLLGLAVGLAAAGATARQRRTPVVVEDPRAEQRLRARIDAVTKRERELARLAGELAAREKHLEQREQAEPAAPAAPPPEPEPEPEPEPVAVPPPTPVVEAGGMGWTLPALEALVRERSAPPEQQEEWANYLFFLREHADADGRLPQSFDGLVNDIFGPLPPRE